MKLSQNSVSTVFFTTKEGKRNGNDPKAPMNPDAPDKRRSGFCIFEGRGGADWSALANPLLAEQKPCDLWALEAGPKYVVFFGLDFPLKRLNYPCSKQEKSATFRLERLGRPNLIRPSHKDGRKSQG